MRNRLSLSGAAILVGLCLAAVVGSFLVPPMTVAMQLGSNLQGPSWAHPLGTDELGRDVLARLLLGARISLAVGVVAVTIALVIGIPLGAIGGYVGGWIDLTLMRLVDILLTFPTLLTAIILVTVLGPSLSSAVIAIGLTQVPVISRLTRAMVLTLKERDFVLATRALGAGHFHTLARHILPNCLSPLLVQASLMIASAILSMAYLSFLGLGARPPTPEWGLMVSSGRVYLRTASHVALFPGLVIMVTVLAFNAVGDGLRDVLDPHGDRSMKGS